MEVVATTRRRAVLWTVRCVMRTGHKGACCGTLLLQPEQTCILLLLANLLHGLGHGHSARVQSRFLHVVEVWVSRRHVPRISEYIITFHVSMGRSASLKLQSKVSSASGSSAGLW